MNRLHTLSRQAGRGIALLAALLLLTLSLTVFSPKTADALPACGTHKKYYSSSAHTTQVGFRYYTCAGVLDPSKSWGVTSPYVISNTYCCDV
jgi:hypothetical protein